MLRYLRNYLNKNYLKKNSWISLIYTQLYQLIN